MDLPLDSRSALRDWMTEQLAELLGEPLDDVRALADDDDLLGCGLDSIRLMYLQERLRAGGAAVDFAQLAQRPCLGDWLDLLVDTVPAPTPAMPETSLAPGQPFALSSVQQAYWLGRGADEVLGNVSCHAFLEFRACDLDPQRLAVAAQCVRQRHPMLRARFIDGCQQILASPPLPCFDLQEWRELPPEQAERDWQALRQWRANECLAVEQGQVFLLGLVRMPAGEDRLWLSLDLLAADVESLRLLLAELGTAYTAPAHLAPPPALHFADHLARRAVRDEETEARARAYWLQRLPSLPDAPALPLACAPETIQRPHTQRLAFTLCARESQSLEQLAARHGVTLSSVFGCAFATILARWSETAEFLLNVPLFNRHDEDPRIGEVIADFTTLLLLECRMDASRPFVEAVKDFQRCLHGAIDHAAFPALEVLREARRQGQPRSAPVVFASNLGEETFVPTAFREAFGELHDMLSQTPQVWLDHQLYRVDDGILLAWDSVIGLFPEGMLQTMFDAYVGVLQQLCDSAWERPLGLPLPWAQQARRARLNGQPSLAAPRTLHHDFFARALAAPSAVALCYRDRCISRGELAERALRMAGGLCAAGVRPGDAVEISLPRGPEQVAAVFAVLAAGACYVPLDIDQPPARRRLIEEAAGVRLVIAGLDDPQASPPRWDSERLACMPALAAPLPLSPQASAYVIYTSGSTGVPKGVEVSHAAAINTIDALLDLLQVSEADRLLTVSALDFDLSVFDLFGGLGAGASLILPSQAQARDAAAWAQAIQHHGVTLWNSAPALLEMALSLPASQADYRSLRAVLLSGDWVALDLPARLRARCDSACELHVLGGATEAGIWSNLQSVDTVPPHWRSIPYGRPLPGQAYRVVDAQGRDVPDLVVGELWIGGASLARGYRNDPELSARRFVHDGQGRWYRTGDRGRYWPDGTLEFLGRVDQQVKVRGQRIELGEVESALCVPPGVESACAVVLEGATASIGAVLVPRLAERADSATQVPEAHRFESLAEAETVVTRTLLGTLLEAPLALDDALRQRWRDWLEDSATHRLPSCDDALQRLGWQAADLAAMDDALRVQLSGEQAAALLLDPWLAPQALAARLPDGREALARMLEALPTPANGERLRVAIVDTRAGLWLDPALIARMHPALELTLFERSRGLLDAAAARLPSQWATQLLDDGLLPAEHLGRYDRVISFAALHTYDTGREGLALAVSLLRPQGSLLLIDLLRDSPLALLGAALLDPRPLRLAPLPTLLEEIAEVGLTPHCLWRSERVALIQAQSPGVGLDAAALHATLAARLPQAMRPDHLWCLPSLPLNANGKVDRRRLAHSMSRALGQGRDEEVAGEPLQAHEEALAECWAALLERPVRQRDANFFSLGGDSLLATRLLAQVRERFGVRLGMADFYRQPTLAALADKVRKPAVDLADKPMEEGVL
ncbi:amino acid adenylation domain-containing protein [Salinicola sp. JS01]|uniref:amino acid adenylation domain-containing protein n=1 Tax=Salinicola sp. JS01 TaxID=3050071 RepID=UPI00255B7F9A|nr:amino acid adenylation domain-containing protein [Salinicola sp. JS01]WIX32331.1 amino acid adenylation domain-containing protein [Salinicola sp. JS01]